MKNSIGVLICFLILLPVNVHAKQWPMSEIAGTAYESACTTKEWHHIQAKLTELASSRAETQLVKLTRAYLCKTDASAQKELLWHAPKKVSVLSEGTGQDLTSELNEASEVLAPQLGNAWRAEVSTTDDNKIQLFFWSNEVCVKTVLFMHTAGNWLITQLSEACD